MVKLHVKARQIRAKIAGVDLYSNWLRSMRTPHMSSIELFDNQSDDSLSIGEQLSHVRGVTISPPTMKKSHLHRHQKFRANEASDHDNDSCSNDDNNFLICPFRLVSLLTLTKNASWKRPMMK